MKRAFQIRREVRPATIRRTRAPRRSRAALAIVRRLARLGLNPIVRSKSDIAHAHDYEVRRRSVQSTGDAPARIAYTAVMTERETNASTPATGKSDKKSAAPQWLGSAIEFAPLGAFLVTWLWSKDLMAATVVVMVASALAVLISYLVHRKIPWMPLMTAVIVGVFGGLTLYLADESFIKMKPTMINTLFAAILFGMLALGKLPLKKLLGHAFDMPDSAWKTLTIRTGLFFLITAILNEAVWRTQPTEIWVYFKFPGLTVMTIGYFLLQIPFIMRHADHNQTS